MDVHEKRKAKQPVAPGGRGRGVSLRPEHIEHICREVAEFRSEDPVRLVDSCLAAFPAWLGFMPEDRRRHWWADNLSRHFPRDRWGGVRDTCRHKARIEELRDLWRAASIDAVRIANRRGRLEMLQSCYDKAVADGKYRDAAYVLHLAEREVGVSEMHAGPHYEVEYTDAEPPDTPAATPAPAGSPGA